MIFAIKSLLVGARCVAIPIPQYALRGLGFMLAASYLQLPYNTLSLRGLDQSRSACLTRSSSTPSYDRRIPPALQQDLGRRLPSWLLGGPRVSAPTRKFH